MFNYFSLIPSAAKPHYWVKRNTTENTETHRTAI